MAGILNKKTRFIDFVVTNIGRKEIAKGNFSPAFASFTDKDCFYDKTEENIKSVSSEEKIYLEAQTNLDIDRIVLKTDDSGNLFVNTQTFISGTSVVGNQIYQSSPIKTELSKFLTGTVFHSASNQIAETSIKNFKKNTFIASKTDFTKGNNFVLQTIDNKDFFTLTNSSPFRTSPINKTINVNAADPLLFDGKLAHFKNFQYLPPVNSDGSSYGIYKDLRSTSRLTYEDIKKGLRIKSLNYDYLEQNDTVNNEVGKNYLSALNRKPLKDINTIIAKERIEAFFSETSTLSNIITQIYEKNDSTGNLKKLEIVDAGEFIDENDPERKIKRVYYVGKVIKDSNGFLTFINMFTVIWD